MSVPKPSQLKPVGPTPEGVAEVVLKGQVPSPTRGAALQVLALF